MSGKFYLGGQYKDSLLAVVRIVRPEKIVPKAKAHVFRIVYVNTVHYQQMNVLRQLQIQTNVSNAMMVILAPEHHALHIQSVLLAPNKKQLRQLRPIVDVTLVPKVNINHPTLTPERHVLIIRIVLLVPAKT